MKATKSSALLISIIMPLVINGCQEQQSIGNQFKTAMRYRVSHQRTRGSSNPLIGHTGKYFFVTDKRCSRRISIECMDEVVRKLNADNLHKFLEKGSLRACKLSDGCYMLRANIDGKGGNWQLVIINGLMTAVRTASTFFQTVAIGQAVSNIGQAIQTQAPVVAQTVQNVAQTVVNHSPEIVRSVYNSAGQEIARFVDVNQINVPGMLGAAHYLTTDYISGAFTGGVVPGAGHVMTGVAELVVAGAPNQAATIAEGVAVNAGLFAWMNGFFGIFANFRF